MSGTPIRIGTRGSALARVQAQLVASGLAARGRAHEVVVIETAGDGRAPDAAWGEGAFVAAIEQALLDGRVDAAVHSAKDVPTAEDPRLAIAAYLRRADPRDALVVAPGSAARSLDTLPPRSRVGTDSPRRAAFVRAQRPDLDVRPLHGNVDTRLRRLDDGEADALVLAVAGLERLGLEDRITERLAPDVVPPAPGQGAIAVQVRAGDGACGTALAALDDRATRIAVETERAFLRASGGGCRAPIGALANVDGDVVRLLGGFARDDGATAIERTEAVVDEAPAAAEALAAGLSGRLGVRLRRPTVLVTRPLDQSATLVAGLAARGVDAVVVPAIVVEPSPAGGPVDEAIGRLAEEDWAVVTSPNGARVAVAAAGRLDIDLRRVRWAAVGRGTAGVLQAAGVTDVWLPSVAQASAIARELPIEPMSRVVVLVGSLAADLLASGLRARDAVVREVVAYRTVEAPPSSRPALAAALEARAPDGIVFASASGVRGLLALAAPPDAAVLLGIPAICIGPETAAAASAAGFTRVEAARAQSADAVAAVAARVVQPAMDEVGAWR